MADTTLTNYLTNASPGASHRILSSVNDMLRNALKYDQEEKYDEKIDTLFELVKVQSKIISLLEEIIEIQSGTSKPKEENLHGK